MVLPMWLLRSGCTPYDARRNLTRAVITKTIIQRVHDIAIKEGIPKGIKMHTSIIGVHDEVSNDEEEVAHESDYGVHDEVSNDEGEVAQ